MSVQHQDMHSIFYVQSSEYQMLRKNTLQTANNVMKHQVPPIVCNSQTDVRGDIRQHSCSRTVDKV
jgi:hypothetical protein